MHELCIAESILEAVQKEMISRPGAKPTRVGLRVGELSAVDVDSLSFCFGAILRGTEWECLQLDLRRCPHCRRCRDCGHEFEVVDYQAGCTQCLGNNTEMTSGDELDFDYLEVETDGTG